MKSRLKAFRWTRFLVAMVVTFAVVIAVGKAMAADTASKPASTEPQATTSVPAAAGEHGPVSAAAVTDVPSSDTATRSYYHQVDAIRTDTELVTAQIENLKAHRELEQAKIGVFKSDAPAPTAPGMPMMQMPGLVPSVDASSAAPESRNPMVAQTSMVDGRWTASIRLPSGGYINNVRSGQDVSGVGKILSISLNDVTVSNGKKTYSLPFASDEAVSVPSRSGVSSAPPLGIR